MLISEKKRIGFTEYEWDGIHVIETPDLLWGRLRSGWDIWNLLNRCLYLRKVTEHFDLIHCFETRPATIYPALYFSKKKHIPIITDWNDWWGRHGLIDVNRPYWYRLLGGWFETYFEEAFRAKAAGLTVIAKGLEQRAIELGVDPENICYISGGASTDYLIKGISWSVENWRICLWKVRSWGSPAPTHISISRSFWLHWPWSSGNIP